jgi:hypothetical protein
MDPEGNTAHRTGRPGNMRPMEVRLEIIDTDRGPSVTLTLKEGDTEYHVFKEALPPPAWRPGSISMFSTDVTLAPSARTPDHTTCVYIRPKE